jgi:predicted DNA-binding transcriptional regulator AlpA
VVGMKDVLNIDECAFLTGYAKSTIYCMTSKNLIPHYKNGRGRSKLYFTKKKIEDWMTRTEIPTEEELEQRAATYNALKGSKRGARIAK